MKLVIDVAKAVDILADNKQRHVAEYELQLEAWKKAYSEYTDSLKAWSQEQPSDGEATKRPQEPTKPEYYVGSYDKLIRKLGVHMEDTIEIDADGYSNEYEQIFENKFEWSGRFASISGGYITSGHINAASLSTVRGE
jgi:hypothetical protein